MNVPTTTKEAIVKILTGNSRLSEIETKQCIHDIYASCEAFSMLIEELESEHINSKTERYQRKLQQLNSHLRLNKKLADIVASLL